MVDFVALDTCVLLNLVPDNKTFWRLERLLTQNALALLLPEVVETEYNSHKGRLPKRRADGFVSHAKALKEALGLLDPTDASEIQGGLTRLIAAARDAENVANPRLVQRVDQLMQDASTVRVPLNDPIRLRAVRRAEASLAPCHLTKNSIRDAEIVESIAEYKRNNPASNIWFVTDNTRDFCDATDHRRPHGDLAALFAGGVNFSISIDETMKRYEPAMQQRLAAHPGDMLIRFFSADVEQGFTGRMVEDAVQAHLEARYGIGDVERCGEESRFSFVIGTTAGSKLSICIESLSAVPADFDLWLRGRLDTWQRLSASEGRAGVIMYVVAETPEIYRELVDALGRYSGGEVAAGARIEVGLASEKQRYLWRRDVIPTTFLGHLTS